MVFTLYLPYVHIAVDLCTQNNEQRLSFPLLLCLFNEPEMPSIRLRQRGDDDIV